MKSHTKIYLTFFGFKIPSDCICEVCGAPAVDINHIQARGMGGNPKGDKDDIENLMAMCRYHHLEFGDVPSTKETLKQIHLDFMRYNGRRSQYNNYLTSKNR